MDGNRLTVGVFMPCCVDQFSPNTASRMTQLLARCGVECNYPEKQTCCGRLLLESGDKEGALRLGARMIELFRRESHVVCCGSGCVAYMKKYFGSLLKDTALRDDSRLFTDKLRDICDFLCHIVAYVPPQNSYNHTVAYVDHSQSLRDYGLHDEPRQLLRQVGGLKLVDLGEPPLTCGDGEVFNNEFEVIGTELARRVLESAIKAGADVITSSDPSCVLHLRSCAKKLSLPIQCRHIVDILT